METTETTAGQTISQQKPARRFLLRGLFFLLALFAADRVVGLGLRYMLYHQKGGRQFEIVYAADQNKADVVVFGSSQAKMHYNPRILKDSLGMTAYNAGMHGTGVLYAEALFNMMLKRYTPKAIVVNIDPFFLYDKAEVRDRMSYLFPFQDRYLAELRPMYRYIAAEEELKNMSMLYRYNNVVSTLVANVAGKHKPNVVGFEPKEGSMKVLPTPEEIQQHIHDTTFYGPPANLALVQSLGRMVSKAREKGIAVVFVSSPMLYPFNEKASQTIVKTDSLAKAMHVPFLKMANTPQFTWKYAKYYEGAHLNNGGANEFTRMLVGKLRPLLGFQHKAVSN